MGDDAAATHIFDELIILLGGQMVRDVEALEFGDDVCAQRMRRQAAGRIARMDARFLDMFHDARDMDIRSVTQRVDVDLDGVVDPEADELVAAIEATLPA